MDEEISIIDSNTRNEKIKNFLTNNKKKIISSVLILVILVIGIYSIDTYKKQATLKLADKYNFASINFKTENPQNNWRFNWYSESKWYYLFTTGVIFFNR